ncbi:hypothetical protein ACHAWF_011068 [Thalassiosira exigua]
MRASATSLLLLLRLVASRPSGGRGASSSSSLPFGRSRSRSSLGPPSRRRRDDDGRRRRLDPGRGRGLDLRGGDAGKPAPPTYHGNYVDPPPPSSSAAAPRSAAEEFVRSDVVETARHPHERAKPDLLTPQGDASSASSTTTAVAATAVAPPAASTKASAAPVLASATSSQKKLSNLRERTGPAALMLAAAFLLLKYTGAKGLEGLVLAMQVGLYAESTGVVESHGAKSGGAGDVASYGVQKWWWFATAIAATSGRKLISQYTAIASDKLDLLTFGMASSSLVGGVIQLAALGGDDAEDSYRRYLGRVACCHFSLGSRPGVHVPERFLPMRLEDRRSSGEDGGNAGGGGDGVAGRRPIAAVVVPCDGPRTHALSRGSASMSTRRPDPSPSWDVRGPTSVATFCGAASVVCVVFEERGLFLIGQSSFWIDTVRDYGLVWVLFPALLVVVNDTMAYVFGVLLGKHKLLPRLSPKKTVEGFVGAGLSTLTAAGPLLQKMGVSNDATKHALTIALYVSLVSPFGGFLASATKRAHGAKDFGTLIPGHGGVRESVRLSGGHGAVRVLVPEELRVDVGGGGGGVVGVVDTCGAGGGGLVEGFGTDGKDYETAATAAAAAGAVTAAATALKDADAMKEACPSTGAPRRPLLPFPAKVAPSVLCPLPSLSTPAMRPFDAALKLSRLPLSSSSWRPVPTPYPSMSASSGRRLAATRGLGPYPSARSPSSTWTASMPSAPREENVREKPQAFFPAEVDPETGEDNNDLVGKRRGDSCIFRLLVFKPHSHHHPASRTTHTGCMVACEGREQLICGQWCRPPSRLLQTSLEA